MRAECIIILRGERNNLKQKDIPNGQGEGIKKLFQRKCGRQDKSHQDKNNIEKQTEIPSSICLERNTEPEPRLYLHARVCLLSIYLVQTDEVNHINEVKGAMSEIREKKNYL